VHVDLVSTLKKAAVSFGEKAVCARVRSVGHAKHEWTSYSSFESVFHFLDRHYQSRIAAAAADSDDADEDASNDDGDVKYTS